MKSKKPKSSTLRDRMLELLLSETIKLAFGIMRIVIVPILLQHIGSAPAPELILV